MKDKILPKRLRELRDKNGYKQNHVADKLGIRSNTLSGYENGKRSPDPDMLVKLAELYNVTTDYLTGRSDQPHLTKEDSFEEFISDPNLRRWHKELSKSDEEDLKKLKEMWEIIIRD